MCECDLEIGTTSALFRLCNLARTLRPRARVDALPGPSFPSIVECISIVAQYRLACLMLVHRLTLTQLLIAMATARLPEDIYSGGPQNPLLRHWLSMDITREMAEESLNSPVPAPAGSFIVRRSTSALGDYAITVSEGKVIRSYKASWLKVFWMLADDE